MVTSENRQRKTWGVGEGSWLVLGRWGSRFGLYLVILILAAAFGLPFLWTVLTSLKTPQEIFIFPPKWLPASPQWNNYVEIWEQAPLGTFFLNSCVVTVLSMTGQILSASLVAYGFARFRFPGRDILFIVLLSTLMLPWQVTIIPVFLIYKFLGWLDTLKPLTIPAYFGGGAFAIFLFRQFFLTIPKELDEAAKIDGANSLWIFFRILVPLSRPIFITMAIFSFLGSWNDFFGPLIFLNTAEKFTLPLGLTYFQQMVGVGATEPTEHLMMAAAMAMTAPCLVVFLVLQRHFVRGIVMSGLKG
jgi:ABC-type glycerol-3-phosphate transport system permease component